MRFQVPGYESPPGSNWGCFGCTKNGVDIRIISSGDENTIGGWEHVSVSTATRCPTWDEMTFVAELFWPSGDTLLMFRPKASEYVNRHEFCLHWWKKTGVDHELPDRICV